MHALTGKKPGSQQWSTVYSVNAPSKSFKSNYDFTKRIMHKSRMMTNHKQVRLSQPKMFVNPVETATKQTLATISRASVSANVMKTVTTQQTKERTSFLQMAVNNSMAKMLPAISALIFMPTNAFAAQNSIG